MKIRDVRCQIGQIQTLMQLLLFEKMIFIIFFLQIDNVNENSFYCCIYVSDIIKKL